MSDKETFFRKGMTMILWQSFFLSHTKSLFSLIKLHHFFFHSMKCYHIDIVKSVKKLLKIIFLKGNPTTQRKKTKTNNFWSITKNQSFMLQNIHSYFKSFKQEVFIEVVSRKKYIILWVRKKLLPWKETLRHKGRK